MYLVCYIKHADKSAQTACFATLPELWCKACLIHPSMLARRNKRAAFGVPPSMISCYVEIQLLLLVHSPLEI